MPLYFSMLMYHVLVDKQTYSENISTKKILSKKITCVFSFTILSCFHFNSVYLLMLQVLCLNQNYSQDQKYEIHQPFFFLFYHCINYITRKFIIIRSSETFSLDIFYFSVRICFVGLAVKIRNFILNFSKFCIKVSSNH